jgi:hypothetical protein
VDTRLITDWNGLMIASLARAGMVFERPDWVGTAIAAFHHVMTVQGDGDRLAHIATNGVKGGPGFADDYANMARAALQLWEVTGDAAYLDRAKAWTGTLDSHFWNNQINGYCFYSDDAAPLFIRPRMLFDNPAPSANGTMLTVLTRLALITGERPYMQRAQSLAVTFGAEANRMLHGSGSFLTGFEYLINALMIVIVGHKGHARTKDLVRAYWSKPIPNGLLVRPRHGGGRAHRLYRAGGSLFRRHHRRTASGPGVDASAAAAPATTATKDCLSPLADSGDGHGTESYDQWQGRRFQRLYCRAVFGAGPRHCRHPGNLRHQCRDAADVRPAGGPGLLRPGAGFVLAAEARHPVDRPDGRRMERSAGADGPL